ncbi:MAG: SRPBCC domain-containing protein [bacterium]|nr:SRPBCC domain-containing protein [bacterium]
MKYFTATINIKASKERIWAILTDAPNYPTWEPGVIKIEGTIASGQKVVAHNKISPNRAFPAKVTEFVIGEKMAWTGGMPLGLFKGVRTFTLAPKADGTIDFTLREEFSGPMLPLIGKTIPDMTQSFQDFVTGLKAYAEKA